MKQRRSSFFGLVLSMTTLLPFRISCYATLQHFSFVLRVSLLTLTQLGRQLAQKLDLPDPGAPHIITISLSAWVTLLPFPTTNSPSSGTVAGLNPFTSILSTSPRNIFSGVLKGKPTLSANLRSLSEKSLCLPSFRPAASPQQKLTFMLTWMFPLCFYLRRFHIQIPGFLYQSQQVATKTCISTPRALPILATFVLISWAFVLPFWMPAWLVTIMILKPYLDSCLMAGATFSLRKSQSLASMGNFLPDFLVMMVSSMSKEAILAE